MMSIIEELREGHAENQRKLEEVQRRDQARELEQEALRNRLQDVWDAFRTGGILESIPSSSVSIQLETVPVVSANTSIPMGPATIPVPDDTVTNVSELHHLLPLPVVYRGRTHHRRYREWTTTSSWNQVISPNTWSQRKAFQQQVQR